MHLLRYDRHYSRRHFLRSLARGTITAGVLAPVWDVIAATGDSAAAYPDEVLSIEHMSAGAVRSGGVLDAGNVDAVKAMLDPVTYRQIKQDGRVVDIIDPPTDIAHLNPASYTEATLRHRGQARLDAVGNVVHVDGGPWIGGHPFPDGGDAHRIIAGIALGWGRHDTTLYCATERTRNGAGELIYEYESVFAAVLATGRVVLDPRPHMPGHEDKLRYNTVLLTSPQSVAGSSFLSVWHTDQSRFPDFHGYLPAFKRVRRYSTTQRFEPLAPGSIYYTSDAWCVGDPFLTWGNFKIVDRRPMLGSIGGQGNGWHSEHPNWEPPMVGGASGEKYFRTPYALVPDVLVVDMEPVKYPRAPYSRRRVWVDARTLTPMVSLAYDRSGAPWKSFEFGTTLYEKPSGERFAVNGETYWSWTHLHIHDIQADRLSGILQIKNNNMGYATTFNDPDIYEDFCTMQAIRQLGV